MVLLPSFMRFELKRNVVRRRYTYVMIIHRVGRGSPPLLEMGASDYNCGILTIHSRVRYNQYATRPCCLNCDSRGRGC